MISTIYRIECDFERCVRVFQGAKNHAKWQVVDYAETANWVTGDFDYCPDHAGTAPEVESEAEEKL